MPKKSARYLGYEIVVEDNNSITIHNNGQRMAKAMGAIREIAALTGFVVNERSNTQQNGSKLVDFLNTRPDATSTASTQAPKQNAGRPSPARKGLPEGYEPSEAELRKYLGEWDDLDDYVDQERALAMLFRGDTASATNTDLRHVMIKCAVLNDFYATNIFRIASVARHIFSTADLDTRLAAGDRSLVEEIAVVDDRRNYSFATKYCSHHRPELFPIYDRYVADVLGELRRRSPGLYRFRGKDALKDYVTFCDAIDDFRKAYGLEAYSYKEIDRYLWQLGKRYYNNYKES